MSEDTVKHPAVLLDYFRRIKAEVLNFKRAMVKEHRGNYYVERTLIKIGSDGKIEVTGNKEHFPTKEEAEAIEAAFKGLDFPKSIHASEPDAKHFIEMRCKDNPSNHAKDFHLLRSRASGKIVMVQQRVNAEDGTKYFVPHTLWSDGLWRSLEPEGALPFWKPREKRSSRIMVHEGAKAADFVDWLLNDMSPEARKARDEHPWTEELSSYEHWGILGGAFAAHRADYGEIRKEAPLEVVFSCDNDWPGRQALKDFSKNYGGTLKGIIFPAKQWPESWDMADKIPEKFFKKGRYIGTGLAAMMIPATYATEVKPNPSGKGRPITMLRDHFAQEWMHSITPEAFIHADWPSDILSSAEFNSKVRPFSDVDDTARLLLACSASKSRRLHYHPGYAPGFSGDEDGAFINTYCASPIKANELATEADWEPWLKFMENLIPDEGDRTEALRWCATLIAKPSTKMLYGLLLISETQGVGKTTLGEKILAPLVGHVNVSFPSETDIVESQFNSWIAHKRLAIVNEIYAGASTKAYNKLKSIITDRRITVNKKHQATYEIENWLHIFACSNSNRALKLSSDDRRWFVPGITNEKQEEGFWSSFNNWLDNEGGLSNIAQWAKLWVIDAKAVRPGETAPKSKAKDEMIFESFSPGMVLVAENLDRWKKQLDAEGRFGFTTDQIMIDMIKNTIHGGKHSDHLEKPSTIRKLAKDRGWYIGEKKTTLWEPKASQARIMATTPEMAKEDPKEILEKGLNPLNINDEAM